jgi:hypothetical protein
MATNCKLSTNITLHNTLPPTATPRLGSLGKLQRQKSKAKVSFVLGKKKEKFHRTTKGCAIICSYLLLLSIADRSEHKECYDKSSPHLAVENASLSF